MVVTIAEDCGKSVSEVWNDAFMLRQPTNYSAVSQHGLWLATQMTVHMHAAT